MTKPGEQPASSAIAMIVRIEPIRNLALQERGSGTQHRHSHNDSICGSRNGKVPVAAGPIAQAHCAGTALSAAARLWDARFGSAPLALSNANRRFCTTSFNRSARWVALHPIQRSRSFNA